MTFGEKLYELRTKKGLSQEQMAELLEVSRQSISKWESDKCFPEMNRVLFLSDYFDVSLDYLMRDLDKEEQSEKSDYHSMTVRESITYFITNLTPKQQSMLYLVIIVALILVCMQLCYLFGYDVGKLIYHVTH